MKDNELAELAKELDQLSWPEEDGKGTIILALSRLCGHLAEVASLQSDRITILTTRVTAIERQARAVNLDNEGESNE